MTAASVHLDSWMLNGRAYSHDDRLIAACGYDQRDGFRITHLLPHVTCADCLMALLTALHVRVTELGG